MAITIKELEKLKKQKNKTFLIHKFKAVSCSVDQIKFPSKLERDCYLVLKKLQEEKKILFFLRQIGFDLPAGYRHFVDFLIFKEGTAFFVESKGRDLAVGRMKREQVEDLFNIKVHVVQNPRHLEKLIEFNFMGKDG